MKQEIILLFFFGTFLVDVYSQENYNATINGKHTECYHKAVLATLDDAPAYIQKGCYDYFGKIDSFSVVLLNQPDIDFYVREVYPIEQVPKEFQTDNLSILISGNILDSRKINSCIPPLQNTDYQGTNMLELKSIKINDQGECSRCNDTTILAVLKDEPAYLHRGCFSESNSFYITLVNKPYGVYSNSIYPCNGIPEKFRIDSLSVLISGNIFRCIKSDPCFPSKPNIRIVPTNLFELKNIKSTLK